jgi:hypothetical protein
MEKRNYGNGVIDESMAMDIIPILSIEEEMTGILRGVHDRKCVDIF